MSGRRQPPGASVSPKSDRPIGALQRKAAAAWLGVGVDHFDREVRPYVLVARVGNLRLWRVADLQAFIDERLEDPPTDGAG